MKIKCEYCESMFDDTLENCPACGAPNKNVRRSTPDQPTTIEELQEWYHAKGLPPENVTRFFIGKDIREARAFGIYKDESSGNFIVYKNKADGSRAVRYEGTDEAYAVNELHTRLKQEILEQKGRNVANQRSGKTAPKRRKKSSSLSAFILFLVIMLIPGSLIGYLYMQKTPAKQGYYMCNDDEHYKGKLFYHYGSNEYGWATYDEEKSEWRKTSVYPSGKLERQVKAKKYYLSPEYDSKYGGTDFKESLLYEDYLNGFNVSQGYYSYGDNYYYHMKPQDDAGWYIYDTDDEDWSYVPFSSVPADLKHQSVATDFWYTPTWDETTQITDFEETDDYQEYQSDLKRQAEERANRDNSYDDDDDDYSWDSNDSWDSGGTDWDSDW